MNFLTFLTIVSVFVSSSISFAGPAEDFAAECARKGLETRGMKRFSTQGADERWFFNASELLHVGAGKFWTGDWKNAAENQQNPIPFLAHFQQLLAEKGIELLLVPVPTKASIYPDKLNGRFKAGEPFSTKPFLELIEAAGLTVLDLEPVFAAERAAGKKIYCEQDSHFSPHACAVIAKLAIDRVREKSWFQGQPRPLEIQRSAPTELGIVGDQVPEEMRTKVAETLEIQYCGVMNDGKIEAVPPDPNSPILLLGDSHTLVFSEGASRGMHSVAAGLLDQLQAEAGFACDLVGSKGSGSKTARMQAYRQAAGIPDYWASKKLVVWCFSVREFTQSMDTLQEIPIERK